MKIGSINKKISNYRHRDRSKLYITARRDWNIIIMGIFFLFLLSFAYNYYVYIDTVVYDNKSVSSGSITEKKSDIEKFKKELDQIFIYFEEKEQYHKNLLEKKEDFENLFGGNEKNSESQGSSQASTSLPEEEGDSLMETFMSNASNTAAVWKSIFIDLFE